MVKYGGVYDCYASVEAPPSESSKLVCELDLLANTAAYAVREILVYMKYCPK